MATGVVKKTLFLIIPLIITFSILLPAIRPVIGKGELIQYWSSAHLLITGGNPYDPDALKALESRTLQEVDFDQGLGLPVFNPPWMMLLLMPLGFLPFDLAVRFWIAVNIAIIGFTIQLVWTEFLRPPDSKGYALILAASFLFYETLNLIFKGQITGLVLGALILGILWLKSGKDIAAGALLIIATIKPHLSYLVLALLLVWIIRHHRWKVFFGMAATIFVSVTIVSVLLPNWLLSYFHLLGSFPIQGFVTTTLGGFFAIELGIKVFRFIGLFLFPLVFPLISLIDKDEWLTAINIALLISLPLSAYGFSFDEVLFLPAIAQIIFWVSKKALPPTASIVTVSGIMAIYLLRYGSLLIFRFVPYHLMIWQPLGLFFLFLYAWKARQRLWAQLQPTV